MKKLVLTLMTCLAFSQSSFAATSGLVESLLEYQAIINFLGDPSSDFDQTEFIVDIKRVTHKIDVLGIVKYQVLARNINKNRTHKYIAVLEVSPNPGVGPNIVEVLSIEPCHYTD